jgi:hypothetical protein
MKEVDELWDHGQPVVVVVVSVIGVRNPVVGRLDCHQYQFENLGGLAYGTLTDSNLIKGYDIDP